MDESKRDVSSLVEHIVSSLVDQADQVEIRSTSSDGGLLIEIMVADEDISKIIGSNGRVIKAIRTLARSAAFIDGIDRVDVEIDS
ncbi:MAG: KH domain-containing protein [Coriobacteriia bacterium]|nr:KH domain-containing protein [Coriobacteriia bacterium]